MKVTVRDTQVLKSVTPLDLMTYLRASGWRHEARNSGKATLWHLSKDDKDYELLAPNSLNLGDYAARVSEILEILSQVTSRSQLQVLFDLSVSNTDVVRVRAASSKYESGTIGLSEGVGLIEHSKEMILAAASSAVQKQSVFLSRKPQQATDYLDKVRLGQTERGSFVLTLLSPVAPQLAPVLEPLFSSDDVVGTVADNQDLPFERQVTLLLARSLWTVKRAAVASDNAGNLDAFKVSVEEGVTSNLCEAVVGLHESSGQSEVDVSFSWSRGRTAPSDIPPTIQISNQIIPIVRDAAKMLRERPPAEPVSIQGFVAKLSRPRPNARGGEVTIHGFIGRHIYKVRVQLAHDDYQQAVVAHEKYKPVSCRGELVKKGNSFRFSKAEGFRVLKAVEFDAGAFEQRQQKRVADSSDQPSLSFD